MVSVRRHPICNRLVTPKIGGSILGKQDTDIQERRVDNPLTGFAQWRAEIETEGAARAGTIVASVNMTTLMGGFHRFGGTEDEKRACVTYKALCERSQVGGARAVDPSREPVDGGWLNPEAVFITGEMARRRLLEIKTHLTRGEVDRLNFVVVGEWGPTPYAKHFFKQRYPDGKAVSQAKVEVRRIAAKLATFLDLVTEGQRSRVRADVEVPQSYTGEISTRKVA